MKHYAQITWAVAFVLLAACRSGSTDAEQTANGAAHIPAEAALDVEQDLRVAPDALMPQGVVINFLRWYKVEYDAMYEIRLLDDSREYTRVDREGTEAYLAYLNESGYISPAYIARWREYFAERAQHFAEVRQGPGYYDGFEFDFVLWTQTIDKTLDAINAPRVLSSTIDNGTALVKISIVMNLGFRLSLYDGHWKIDEIFNLGFYEETAVQETPLLKAVRTGNVAKIQAMLDAGTNLNARFADGATLLMAAVWFGQESLVQYLLDRGASLEKRDGNGDSALIWAWAKGNLAIVTALQNAGAALEPDEDQRFNYIINSEYQPVF